MAAKIMKEPNQEDLVNDLDCFLQIIKNFQDLSDNEEELEVWKYNTLIRLMDELKEKNDAEFVKNALIVITVLFKITPADLYDSVGFELSELNELEKENCLSLLFDEMFPN